MNLRDTGHGLLERRLGLKEAAALNMIDMVGIGPFIVVPLVARSLGGPLALCAWVAGAILAVIDGFVWAELGAAMPLAGGTYNFLKEAYGPGRWGRLMSFLFIWQTMFQAPMVISSGATGFAQYLTYLLPLGPAGEKLAAVLLIAGLVALLYRRIDAIGRISLFLWIGVLCMFAWMIWGGATHFQPSLLFSSGQSVSLFSWTFFLLLGQSTVQTTYTYLGYYNICNLGGEVRDPGRTIPRSIFLSIGGIAVLYLAMQTGIFGVVPSQDIASSKFIVSTFIERLYGRSAADAATVLILWIALASLFSALLGYSRIPYAAAEDGTFFRVFARLHPTKNFPHVSLLVVAAAAAVFSLFFSLADAIRTVLAVRILVQFIGQAAGVMILRKRTPPENLPFRMPFYPLPAVLACIAWGAVFLSTGTVFVIAGLAVAATGCVVFLLRAALIRSWPFRSKPQTI